VEPRGFRAIGSGVLFNFRAISKSASRPGMPAGLSRDGAGTGGIPMLQRWIAVSGGPRRTGHKRDQPGLGGRQRFGGPRRKRNFGIEMEAAEFLRAFRFEHVPRSSPGIDHGIATQQAAMRGGFFRSKDDVAPCRAVSGDLRSVNAWRRSAFPWWALE
jgi:hypothetical protein